MEVGSWRENNFIPTLCASVSETMLLFHDQRRVLNLNQGFLRGACDPNCSLESGVIA